MWLLILEALAALALLVFIVVWTMSGRRRESRPSADVPGGDAGERGPDSR